MQNKTAWGLLIILVAFMFPLFLWLIPLNKPPEVVTKLQVITVEKIVPVEIIKEVIKEVPTKLTDWESVEELRAFLASDDTDEHIYLTATEEGSIKLEGRCEVRAINLMNNAQTQGKRLSFVPLHRAEYYKWYGVWIEEEHYHAICGAIIGDNEFWYIEPSTDKIWIGQYME